MRLSHVLSLLCFNLYLSLLPSAEATFGVSEAQLKNRMIDASRAKNVSNIAVDFWLTENAITLPAGDYLLIAQQPMGVVSAGVIIDFTSNQILLPPQSHEQSKEIDVGRLEQSDKDFLLSFLTSDLMRNFPASSGLLGYDGSSTVVYFKAGNRERMISHWQPEHVAMFMFEGVMHRYYRHRLNK